MKRCIVCDLVLPDENNGLCESHQYDDDAMIVDINDGKYTVVIHNDGKGVEALRYKTKWRDLTGDNLIYWLAVELYEARKELKALKGDYR